MTGIRVRTGAPRRTLAEPPPPPPTLRSHAPGSGAAAECVIEHGAAPSRSRLARLVGIAPLRPRAAELHERVRIERETAALLHRLPADWTVLHSVPVEDGVVPHLLVGPAGVFALFPQPQAGASIWLSADLLAVDGAGSDAVSRAEASAGPVRERLAGVLRNGIPVVPLVAFPRPERIVIRTPPRRAQVLALDEVVPWLRSLPEVCSAVIVDRIADAAALPETWGRDASVPGNEEGLAALEAELEEADRRWVRTVQVVIAGSLVLLTATAAAGSALLAAFFGGG